MTTNVLLVRHGQTDSNVTGFYMGRSNEDLNEVGYTQARCLSSRLASLPIASVYTSPLQRACTTATILAEPHKLEPKVLDDLIEIGLGDWQGLHMDEIKVRWSEVWQQWRTDPSEVTLPNGESFDEVAERAIRAFERVVGANRGKRAVIVTHDAIVKVVVAHVLGAPNSIYRRVEISNASLSMIRVMSRSSQLARLNDTSHLEG
ncbi:histidine phosphatase family protein [Chloroflexota bacterium]